MRRVAILGLSPATHDLVPLDWEIWGLPWDSWAVRCTRLFEMHDRAMLLWDEASARPRDYIGRLKDAHCPIYMQTFHPDIPMSRTYPRRAVAEDLWEDFPRPDQDDYFCSSIAYMLALAIFERVDEIGLWGVDLDPSRPEFLRERPCDEFLIGLALGHGIRVHVNRESQLLKFDGRNVFGNVPVEYVGRYGAL